MRKTLMMLALVVLSAALITETVRAKNKLEAEPVKLTCEKVLEALEVKLPCGTGKDDLGEYIEVSKFLNTKTPTRVFVPKVEKAVDKLFKKKTYKTKWYFDQIYQGRHVYLAITPNEGMSADIFDLLGNAKIYHYVGDLSKRYKTDEKFKKYISGKIREYPEKTLSDREPETFEEADKKFYAHEDESFKNSPPTGGPENDETYFAWKGTLAKKTGNLYIFWDAKKNPFYDPSDPLLRNLKPYLSSGFAVKNIKKKHANLRFNTRFAVVGRYIENTKITLTNGEEKIIPVLGDAYIFEK